MAIAASMDVATAPARQRRESMLTEHIEAQEHTLHDTEAIYAELQEKVAFQRRALAFQQRVSGLTRSRITSQLQSTAVQSRTRMQTAKAAELLGSSAENQQKGLDLQGQMHNELDKRARAATLRLEQLRQEQQRLEFDVARRNERLLSHKATAAKCEAMLDERRENSETRLAREARAIRREGQSRRRHFDALLASANEVLDAEASAAKRSGASVVPSPRHAIEAGQAYERACELRVPVELWPEFCLTVLVGGVAAAQPPELFAR